MAMTKSTAQCTQWCAGYHQDRGVLHPTDIEHYGELVKVGLTLEEVQVGLNQRK